MSPTENSFFNISQWLPQQYRVVSDHAEALRIRTFLILILLCIAPLTVLLFLLAGAVLIGNIEYWQPALITLLILSSQTACLLYFLKSGNINLCSSIYAAIIYFLIGAATFYTGGWYSPACQFMLALPLLACLVVKRTTGIIYSITVFAMYTAFYIMSVRGYATPQFIVPEYTLPTSIAMWITTLFFIVGCLLLFNFSTQDLAEVIKNEKDKWQKDLDYDELTSTYNKNIFLAIINDLKNKIVDSHTEIGIIYIRANNLGAINKDFGLDIGDEILKIIAARIKDSLRSGYLCRFTANSFVIFIDSVKNPGEFISQIIAIQNTLQEDIIFKNEMKLKCFFKIGGALTDNHRTDTNSFIQAAIVQADDRKNPYVRV